MSTPMILYDIDKRMIIGGNAGNMQGSPEAAVGRRLVLSLILELITLLAFLQLFFQHLSSMSEERWAFPLPSLFFYSYDANHVQKKKWGKCSRLIYACMTNNRVFGWESYAASLYKFCCFRRLLSAPTGKKRYTDEPIFMQICCFQQILIVHTNAIIPQVIYSFMIKFALPYVVSNQLRHPSTNPS